MKRYSKFGELEIIEDIPEREKRKRIVKHLDNGITQGALNLVTIQSTVKVKYLNVDLSAKNNKNRSKKARLIEQNRQIQDAMCKQVQRSINNTKKHNRMLKYKPVI